MCEQYSNHVLQVTIAKLLKDIGFKSVKNLPLQLLAEVLKKFIIKIGKQTKIIAEMENCSEPNILHVEQAFRKLNISLDELSQFKEDFPNEPNPTAVPLYPTPKENNFNFLRPGSDEVLTRPIHVFDYLPPMDDIPSTTNSQVPEEEEANNNDNHDAKPPVTLKITKSTPRDLDSIFMTSSGFISPAKQGKEAKNCLKRNKRKLSNCQEDDTSNENIKKAKKEEKIGDLSNRKIHAAAWKGKDKGKAPLSRNQEPRTIKAITILPPEGYEPLEHTVREHYNIPKRVRFCSGKNKASHLNDEAIPGCSYVRESGSDASSDSNDDGNAESLSGSDPKNSGNEISSDSSDSDSAVIFSEKHGGTKKSKKVCMLPFETFTPNEEGRLLDDIIRLRYVSQDRLVLKRKRKYEEYLSILKRKRGNPKSEDVKRREVKQQIRIMRISVSEERIREIKATGSILKYTDNDGVTVYICPICHCLEDLEPMIFCDNCNNWFHFDCVGLTEAPQESLWYCSRCSGSLISNN